jgi:Glycosyl transferase family 2
LRKPKISVLLVVKNAMPFVTGALDSLKQQTFNDFEVVVADGASTDGTLDALHDTAKELQLRIVSEPDRSLADASAKAIPRLNADIVATLCADERYYPNTLEQVLKWFEAEPDAVMCGGKLDFINEQDKVIDTHLTAPFNLSAHLACELVPSILTSFFNRRLIGEDFRFDPDVPTCPDYEFWARLGFRFSAAAFKRYDVSVAQAYRTRVSMSFRAESFTQFCRDKLTHLNNLLASGYVEGSIKATRQRASAGIHMWAAEQLNGIEPGHPDILAHCAEAARYDKSYVRIPRLLAAIGNARYDAASGIVMRNRLSPRTTAIASLECSTPSPHWAGAAILGHDPLTVQTSSAPWGYSLEMSVADRKSIGEHLNGGQYWVQIDLEVIEGGIGISTVTPNQELFGELIFRQSDGRAVALIPLATDVDLAAPVMIRSGGHPSSVLRVHRAELMYDPDRNSGAVAASGLDGIGGDYAFVP